MNTTAQPVTGRHCDDPSDGFRPVNICPAFDADNRCIGCGEHIADPCAPDCTRAALEDAADDGARVMTAAQIMADRYTRGDRSAWWIIAEHLRNRWIRPGSYLACVAPDGGMLAPFSFGTHDTADAAAAQVRGNLRYYTHGWVVTNLGAWRITAD